MKRDPIKVLLVEDNPGDARLIRELLADSRNAQFEFEWVDRLSKGLQRAPQGGVDIILLDLRLPDSNGIDTFVKIHRKAPSIPVIPLTGMDDEELAVRVVRAGAQDYLVKGEVDTNLLTSAIRYAIERKKTQVRLAPHLCGNFLGGLRLQRNHGRVAVASHSRTGGLLGLVRRLPGPGTSLQAAS